MLIQKQCCYLKLLKLTFFISICCLYTFHNCQPVHYTSIVLFVLLCPSCVIGGLLSPDVCTEVKVPLKAFPAKEISFWRDTV